MFNPVLIANYFVAKNIEEKGLITPMKVVKLTYIAHGWWLVLQNESLLDENPEAWTYGPIIPRVYYAFKKYGTRNIDHLEHEPFYSNGDERDLSNIPDDAREFLDSIWSGYKRYDGIELSALTHMPHTPWDIVWNHMGGKYRQKAQIPDNLIKTHYSELFKSGSAVKVT